MTEENGVSDYIWYIHGRVNESRSVVRRLLAIVQYLYMYKLYSTVQQSTAIYSSLQQDSKLEHRTSVSPTSDSYCSQIN